MNYERSRNLKVWDPVRKTFVERLVKALYKYPRPIMKELADGRQVRLGLYYYRIRR